MSSSLRTTIYGTIFLAILLGGVYCSVPRTYDVPAFVTRAGTNYWELTTGSHIGYLHLEHTSQLKKSPIVYVHGGPGGMVRDVQIEALKPLTAQGHDLYFYDQIGSGHSARLANPTDYSVVRHSADLHAVLQQIDAPKIILIGHSWGAVLVANYLQNYPTDRIEKVLFEVPGPILPVDPSRRNPAKNLPFVPIKPELTNYDANERMKSWRVRWVRAGAIFLGTKLGSDTEMDQYMALWDRELNRSTTCTAKKNVPVQPGSGYFAHIMTVQRFNEVADRREAFAQLRIPVLVLMAECDNQPSGYAAEYLDLIPSAELAVLGKSGHDMATDQPKLYLEIVSNFLAKPKKN